MMRIALIVSIGCLLAACRSTKNIQTAMAKKDTAVAVVIAGADAHTDSLQHIQNTLNQLQKNHIDFTTFAGKINVDYKDGGNKSYNVNAFVRMKKDSAIWISINAIFGIEAMRALVTADSVKLLDKQNKTYTQRPISFLQEVTGLPLNLATLQDLIIGNPVFFDTTSIASYTQAGNTINLVSLGKWFKNLLTVTEPDTRLVHSKLDDINPSRSRTADLTYSNYETQQGVPFSTKRTITIAEKNKLDIALEFKQYEMGQEVSFPFSIPKNYSTR